VPLSIGVAKVQAVKAAGAADWFGLVLATIAMYPGVGDAIGFLGRALRDGAGAGARPAAQALLVAIGNITTSEINGMMSKLVPNLTRDAHAAAIASYNKFKSDLQSSLT
jgi:hypothetical protein